MLNLGFEPLADGGGWRVGSGLPNVEKEPFFRLTLLRGEAYIPPLGAPSAYGVIARL
jgi:hypothetical protein